MLTIYALLASDEHVSDVAVQLVSSGADGLLKLWNVRSTECLNTFDAHEDKVCYWTSAAAALLE